MTGFIDKLDYHAHYYGPYSDAVSSSVNRLKAIGFIDEITTSTGFISSSGFEAERHDYRLNDDGIRIADQKAKQHSTSWVGITDAVKRIRKAGNIDYMELSIAAKIYFMLEKKEGPISRTQLQNMAKRFGWKFSDNQEIKAERFLKKMGIITISE